MPLCTEYFVHYKEYETVEDYKNKINNFKENYKIVKIKITNSSSSSNARTKFLSEISSKDKKRIVITRIHI